MSLIDDLQRRWRVASLDAAAPVVAGPRWARFRALPRAVVVLIGVAGFLLLYYGLGGALSRHTDADLTLRPTAEQLPPGGSVAVGQAARLIGREVDDNRWVPNDTALAPTALLSATRAFQRGVHATLAAVARALALGAERSGDPGAADLALAAQALAADPARGWLHGEWPFVGGAAEGAYRDAAAALARYNGLPAAAPRLDRSPATLALLSGTLAAAVEAEAAAVDRRLTARSDESLSERFFAARGRAYAADLIARALREDFAAAVRDRAAAAPLTEAIDALDAAATLDPWVIDESDVTAQGYHLLVAAGRLRAVEAAARR